MLIPEGTEWFELVVGIVALVAALSCPLTLRKRAAPREWSTSFKIIPMAIFAFVFINRAFDFWHLAGDLEESLLGAAVFLTALLLMIHALNGSVNRWIDSLVDRIFQ